MTAASGRNWVRAVALFDLAATAPMAVPGLADHYVAWLFTGFGFAGSIDDVLPWPVSTAVFIVLTGILAVLWNGCRAWAPEHGVMVRFDIFGRLAVAAALVWFIMARGAPGILWLFVGSELIGAAIERAALRRAA